MSAILGFTHGVKRLVILGLGGILVGLASLCLFTAGDRRLFALVPSPREFLTLGKQNVVATGFILWRVLDPAKFMQTR